MQLTLMQPIPNNLQKSELATKGTLSDTQISGPIVTIKEGLSKQIDPAELPPSTSPKIQLYRSLLKSSSLLNHQEITYACEDVPLPNDVSCISQHVNFILDQNIQWHFCKEIVELFPTQLQTNS